MIPLKLQIKNFLSYGSNLQTIDFEPFNLICLSGKNGHGKSALLDAMTWALWGIARKVSGGAKADEGLLRLGQTNMLVIFDFEFNKHVYRIRREYLQTYGKPIASLEFGIINVQTSEFIPLTDKTIRETQKKIEQTLHLNFETFSNSAFLRQGSSNEFSKKSSKDRKEILATILGLEKYETIKKLAQEQAKSAINKKTALSAVQEKREQEITTKSEIEQNYKILNQKIDAFHNDEKSWRNQFDVFLQKQTQNVEKHTLHDVLLFKKNKNMEQKLNYEKQLLTIFHQWREINKKRKSISSLSELQKEKIKLQNDLTYHQNLFSKTLEQKEQLLKIKQDLYEIEQKHKNDYINDQQMKQLEYERILNEQKNQLNTKHIIEQQIQNLTTELDITSIEIENLTKQKKLNTISKDEIIKQEQLIEKRKAAYQQFVAQGNWLTKESQSLTRKKKLVHDDDDPSCPLCEQNLSASRRKLLKNRFFDQEKTIVHRLERLKKIIPQLKEILLQQHETITQLKEQFKYNELIDIKINDLNKTKQKIESSIIATKNEFNSIEKILKELIISLEKQKTILAKDTSIGLLKDITYLNLTTKKEALEKNLINNSYNPEVHKNIQIQLTKIEHKLLEFESIKFELERQNERKEQISNLSQNLKSLNNEIRLNNEQLIQFDQLKQETDELCLQEKKLNDWQNILREKKDQLMHEKGSIENQLNQLKRVIQEFENEKQNIKQLDKIIDDFQIIASAMGKDGIQALLIEEAIPEIEQEANYLLSKLTNNQATIFIESLRDLKKGGSKETLDINISDSAGIRPYELFSGGEAFRIDFALRIAISKLLAKRAGTALQTLIIDEGFGSQDEEGLSYIMDALYKIQDDFSKIIIVSHLPSMKDQFPIHFFVEKGTLGSTVRILEQG